jgi:hypothetical protein
MRLINRLQATGTGCQWLLDQWAVLRDLRERGVPWLAGKEKMHPALQRLLSGRERTLLDLSSFFDR